MLEPEALNLEETISSDLVHRELTAGKKLPKLAFTVTGWSRLSNFFKGILFRDICDIVKPLPEAVVVTSYGNTFYTSSLPLKDYMLDDDVILAESIIDLH